MSSWALVEPSWLTTPQPRRWYGIGMALHDYAPCLDRTILQCIAQARGLVPDVDGPGCQRHSWGDTCVCFATVGHKSAATHTNSTYPSRSGSHKCKDIFTPEQITMSKRLDVQPLEIAQRHNMRLMLFHVYPISSGSQLRSVVSLSRLNCMRLRRRSC